MKVQTVEDKRSIVASSSIQKKSVGNSVLSFIDNRPIAAIQKRMQHILNNPIQKKAAYDARGTDTLHFSDIVKVAIETCASSTTEIPDSLKGQVGTDLQTELTERAAAMEKCRKKNEKKALKDASFIVGTHGGDEGHEDQYDYVESLANLIASLPKLGAGKTESAEAMQL